MGLAFGCLVNTDARCSGGGQSLALLDTFTVSHETSGGKRITRIGLLNPFILGIFPSLTLTILGILVLVSKLLIYIRLCLGIVQLCHPQPAGRHPQEVVLLELVNLVVERVEPALVSSSVSRNLSGGTYWFSFSSTSNIRL